MPIVIHHAQAQATAQFTELMRALAAQDNLAEALEVYGQLSECLRDQLGVSPSQATRQLYEALLATT